MHTSRNFSTLYYWTNNIFRFWIQNSDERLFCAKRHSTPEFQFFLNWYNPCISIFITSWSRINYYTLNRCCYKNFLDNLTFIVLLFCSSGTAGSTIIHTIFRDFYFFFNDVCTYSWRNWSFTSYFVRDSFWIKIWSTNL